MEKEKKLLIVHPAIATYRVDFFNSLWTSYDAKVVLLRNYLKSQPEMTIDVLSKELFFQPSYLGGKNLLAKSLQLCKELRQNCYDLVLVPECGFLSIVVLLYRLFSRRQFKVVSLIDDSYDMAVEGNQFSWKHKLGESVCIPFFNEIICVEPRVTSYFQARYSKGYTFPIIRNDKKARERYSFVIPLSQQYIYNYKLAGKRVILFVGRLIEIKNPQGLIKAFINAKCPDTKLVIVGTGNYEQKIKECASNCDDIIFTGRLSGDELLAWYNVANIFCLPSFVEPFGAVTNEALLAGCFSIISKYAGSQCLIEEGINGRIINPTQQNCLEKALCEALDVTNTISDNLQLKKNLMRIDFETEIIRLVSHLNSL